MTNSSNERTNGVSTTLLKRLRMRRTVLSGEEAEAEAVVSSFHQRMTVIANSHAQDQALGHAAIQDPFPNKEHHLLTPSGEGRRAGYVFNLGCTSEGSVIPSTTIVPRRL